MTEESLTKEEMSKIISALPTTADGVPVTPRMILYLIGDGGGHVRKASMRGVVSDDVSKVCLEWNMSGGTPTSVMCSVGNCYSTYEKAVENYAAVLAKRKQQLETKEALND